MAFRGASPPGPPTRAVAFDPMGALGGPQIRRRSSLIAHSFTSSYTPGVPLRGIMKLNATFNNIVKHRSLELGWFEYHGWFELI